MFEVLQMGSTGLRAQRTRMDTIANNVLNINTTRNEAGEKVPFRRRMVIFQAGAAEGSNKAGVHVKQIKLDSAPFQKRYDPGHPDARSDGTVLMPNVDLSTEFVNMLEATRAYEATINMMETTKAMYTASLRLIA
jgi:flagellar basal-body rod protein FlgC